MTHWIAGNQVPRVSSAFMIGESTSSPQGHTEVLLGRSREFMEGYGCLVGGGLAYHSLVQFCVESGPMLTI